MGLQPVFHTLQSLKSRVRPFEWGSKDSRTPCAFLAPAISPGRPRQNSLSRLAAVQQEEVMVLACNDEVCAYQEEHARVVSVFLVPFGHWQVP